MSERPPSSSNRTSRREIEVGREEESGEEEAEADYDPVRRFG